MTWTTQPAEIDLTPLKLQFAKLLLRRPKEPLRVAKEMFPDDNNRAMNVGLTWPNDPVVREAQTELLESDDESFLPTKAQWALSVWEKAHSDVEPDDFMKLMKLYAEGRGFIQKQSISVDNSTKTINLNTPEEKKEAFEMIVTAHKEFDDYD
jgi:hypothetical protein